MLYICTHKWKWNIKSVLYICRKFFALAWWWAENNHAWKEKNHRDFWADTADWPKKITRAERKKTEFSENTINIRLFYTYKLPVIIKDILYIITKNSSFMQSSCLFTFHHFFAHNFSSYHHSIILFVELIFHEKKNVVH